MWWRTRLKKTPEADVDENSDMKTVRETLRKGLGKCSKMGLKNLKLDRFYLTFQPKVKCPYLYTYKKIYAYNLCVCHLYDNNPVVRLQAEDLAEKWFSHVLDPMFCNPRDKDGDMERIGEGDGWTK